MNLVLTIKTEQTETQLHRLLQTNGDVSRMNPRVKINVQIKLINL